MFNKLKQWKIRRASKKLERDIRKGKQQRGRTKK